MLTLRINITGISCLVDERVDAQGRAIDPFHKRVLLPTDTIFNQEHPPHIPYVEIPELDLFNQPGTIQGLSEQYERGGVPYRRFELYGHRLWIDDSDIDMSQGWSVSSLYNYHVIKMKEVAPLIIKNPPKTSCFDLYPPATLISGHFDMTYGHLTIGDVDAHDTAFTKTPSWPKRRLAVSSVLEVKLTSAQPRFYIQHMSDSPGQGTLVRLKTESVGISIGNLPLRELDPVMGQPSTDNFPYDFQMFYKLAADPVPENPPLPTRPAGLNVACSNTGWP